MSNIKKKWDGLDKNVQKWATRLGAIATIVGILATSGGWIVSQLDNAVAARIENQTVAVQQEVQKLSDNVDTISEENSEQISKKTSSQSYYSKSRSKSKSNNSKSQSNYNSTVEIEKVAHHYFKDLGGNSYMSSLYAKYCKQYGADCEIMYK